MKNVDYTGKCGTCVHFERDGEYRRGWCHRTKYDGNTAHDPKHPYPHKNMSWHCKFHSSIELVSEIVKRLQQPVEEDDHV